MLAVALTGQETKKASPVPTVAEATHAKEALLHVFTGMPKTGHSFGYSVTIDFETGEMTLYNKKFRFGDLDSQMVSTRTWSMHDFDARFALGRDIESTTISLHCFGRRPCITTGSFANDGTLVLSARSADLVSLVSFEVYKAIASPPGFVPGLWDRDREAERVAVDSLVTLIRYFRLAKR